MASSAVYRYVAQPATSCSRRLIVAAYDSLADAVEAALAEQPEAAPPTSSRLIARAARAWARWPHPHEYALIYGSPVPDYHAPPERTVGRRHPGPAACWSRCWPRLESPRPGDRPGEPGPGPPAGRPGLRRDGADHRLAAPRTRPAWTLVLGAVSSEVFEQLGADTVADPEAFFDLMVDTATAIAGGAPPAP